MELVDLQKSYRITFRHWYLFSLDALPGTPLTRSYLEQPCEEEIRRYSSAQVTTLR
jgi:hypothetical protein